MKKIEDVTPWRERLEALIDSAPRKKPIKSEEYITTRLGPKGVDKAVELVIRMKDASGLLGMIRKAVLGKELLLLDLDSFEEMFDNVETALEEGASMLDCFAMGVTTDGPEEKKKKPKDGERVTRREIDATKAFIRGE